ncbi:MAG: hypothetical protein ACRD6W_09820 [Nitrososphaerales archaeon]
MSYSYSGPPEPVQAMALNLGITAPVIAVQVLLTLAGYGLWVLAGPPILICWYIYEHYHIMRRLHREKENRCDAWAHVEYERLLFEGLTDPRSLWRPLCESSG